MSTYYHVTPSHNESSIQEHGLKPTEAPECDNGMGIHLADNLGNARRWVSHLRASREDFETEYTILEVGLSDEASVIKDEYVGQGTGGAVVLCTSEPIPSDRIQYIEWL